MKTRKTQKQFLTRLVRSAWTGVGTIWAARLFRATLAFWVCATTHLSAATFYEDVNSPNPTPPYATGTTAASAIQDAIDVALAGDEILVNDGLYQ
jgi:hypothetical protein